MQHDIPAVVLDLSATGIGIVRSLKEKGIRVYAYDTKGKYEIGKTWHATCGICPNPASEEEELLRFLTSIGKNFAEKAVLYAGSDDFVQFISKYRTELSRYYRFLLPEHSLVEAVLDKRLTYELARKHNIPCPKTFVIHDEHQLEQIIHEVTFPCILKPVYSSDFRKRIDHRLYKKAIMVEQASELREGYLFYRQFGELMIQEVIPGNEACIYSVKTFFDEQMNVIGVWMNQKIHQFPPHFGSTALALSVRDEEVVEACVSFLNELQFKGLAITEFKKDPRDGKLKFIEINPRIGLTQRLSIACGVDLAYLYYLSLTDQNPSPVNRQKEGIKWVYLVRDFLSFRQKQKNGEMTFTEWIKCLSGGEKVEALFAWDDPLPFVRSFTSHLRNLWIRK
ncbi:putative ATP-grasp superfamily ATP-dependent carboligase [Aneurinibacillus soli]|uniref:D-aspartate ligase n=1 Tax=Aneurinibacillus soli TaxID=1500254 RepID=A0A0U5BC53_9BACL|nr:ATP-grasp domain-containing protein [Aneurinibacillus soli]PYE64352.1 putative ATP-grasp superfamily ATP-dependent carboligase [Aneurinibacillus soli]BAU28301.1 D-aspartate ligase [Aneurinibacillus soli]